MFHVGNNLRNAAKIATGCVKVSLYQLLQSFNCSLKCAEFGSILEAWKNRLVNSNVQSCS